MKTFQGTSISCGYATGKAGLYRKDLPIIPCYSISKEQVEGEWLRFMKALELTKCQLTDCKRVVAFSMGADKADVFEVQIALLEDSYIQQQLRSALISELKNVDVEMYTCWKDGYMKVSGKPLADILMDLSHYYGVQITLKDTALWHDCYYGKLELQDSLETVLCNLSPFTSCLFHVEKDGDEIQIISKQ